MCTSIVLAVLWAYTLYHVRVEMNVLRTNFETHVTTRTVKDEAWRAEFDNIYRTLYAPPDTPTPTAPPAPPRKPSTVEIWQLNRDKAISDRLAALEKWR